MIRNEIDFNILLNKPIDSNTKFVDLSITTYNGFDNENIGTYVIKKEEEGRMDLVSKSLYGDTKYVHYLCKINQIFNPHIIKSGQVLLWNQFVDIKKTTINPNELEITRDSLIQANKASNVDSRRVDFLNKPIREPLPPVINGDKIPQTIIEGDSIIVTPNLINNNVVVKPPTPVIPKAIEKIIVDKQTHDVIADTYTFIPSIKSKNFTTPNEFGSISESTFIVTKPVELKRSNKTFDDNIIKNINKFKP